MAVDQRNNDLYNSFIEFQKSVAKDIFKGEKKNSSLKVVKDIENDRKTKEVVPSSTFVVPA